MKINRTITFNLLNVYNDGILLTLWNMNVQLATDFLSVTINKMWRKMKQ